MGKTNEQFSYTLPKSEKLKSKLEIEDLFLHATAIKAYPLKILLNFKNDKQHDDVYPKLLVSVPKKKFKLAKDRNLLKRRIKEAYRLNKIIIKESNVKSIGIIYVSNRTETFNIIQDKLILGLNRLKEKNS